MLLLAWRKQYPLWEWTTRGPGHIRVDILWGRSSFQAHSGSRQDSDPCGCVTVSFLAVSRKSLSAHPFHLIFSILSTSKVCPSPQSLFSLSIHPKQTLYVLILAPECFAWLWLRLPRFYMVVVPVAEHDLTCYTFTFRFFSKTADIYSASSYEGSLLIRLDGFHGIFHKTNGKKF